MVGHLGEPDLDPSRRRAPPATHRRAEHRAAPTRTRPTPKGTDANDQPNRCGPRPQSRTPTDSAPSAIATPARVAEAYDLDIARAAGDTDDQVAATVAEWERAQGLPVRDWRAQGTEEGRNPQRRCAYPSLAPVPEVIGVYLEAGWTIDGGGQWHPPLPDLVQGEGWVAYVEVAAGFRGSSLRRRSGPRASTGAGTRPPRATPPTPLHSRTGRGTAG